MTQQVFIRWVGFSDVERHALETGLREPTSSEVQYLRWTPGEAQPPAVILLDGSSAQGRAAAEAESASTARLIWVGNDPPPGMWHVLPRPVSWRALVAVLDQDFVSTDSGGLDFDIQSEPEVDSTEQPTVPPDELPEEPELPNRVLIVFPDLDDRLYLRAKLALNHLTFADEAESAAQARELLARHRYRFALVDLVQPDCAGWDLLREIRAVQPEIAHVLAVQPRVTLFDRIRARRAGLDALLPRPLDPDRLQVLLRRARPIAAQVAGR